MPPKIKPTPNQCASIAINAIKTRNSEELKDIVKEYNFTESTQETAWVLGFAVKHGDKETVKELLDAGIDPNIQFLYDFNEIGAAIKGPARGGRTWEVDPANDKMTTPLHLAIERVSLGSWPFRTEAARRDELERLEEPELQHKAENLRISLRAGVPKSEKIRLIMEAQEQKKMEDRTWGPPIVKMLLMEGANPNNENKGLAPTTPLKFALEAYYKYKGGAKWTDELIDCCKALLRAGAGPDDLHLPLVREDQIQGAVDFVNETKRELHQEQKEQNIPKILQLAKNEIIPPEVLEIIAEKVYNQKYDHEKQRKLWCKENNIQLY